MQPIIAANWKMHKTAAEAAAFCRSLCSNEGGFNGVEVLICPPYTALSAVSAAIEGTSFKLGAQNMHFETGGAYTGEIAAPMLLEHGVEYVIVGHSERRLLLGEDDGIINRKLKTAFESALKPIFCIGETADDREKGLTEEVIAKQLAGGLDGISPLKIGNLVVAYEPVWAIGSGRAASPDDAEKAAQVIEHLFRERFDRAGKIELRVQYGGSVNVENIASFINLPSVHGALVGGASLEAEVFCALIRAARKAEQD